VKTPVLHGVDFSGADKGGLHKIRIATLDSGSVQIARADRGQLLRAIIDSAALSERHIWRIDAPVGLPLATLRAHGVQEEWLASAQWALESGSPRAWRSMMRSVSREEPRRRADIEARTPMAPMNLRIFKQTWTLMCEVLLPLHAAGVSIVPMAPTASNAMVCEGCPSSVLQRRGWPARGYKGSGGPPRQVRHLILQKLAGTGLRVPPRIAAEAEEDEEGDALDALLLLTPPQVTVVPREALVEGLVY
jgi:hypothetical protein